MTYCTLADAKGYLGILSTETADDALLTQLLAASQAIIDRLTGRTFEASADGTRHYTVGRDTDGRVLYLDQDLCQITSITTNADDESGGVSLSETDYYTLPRNESTWYAIVLRRSSAAVWAYTSDPVDAIAVTGRWAWSLTAPADVAMACQRLAAYLYRQKDAQVFDVAAMAATGMVTIPQGLPKDVRQLLEPYVRRV